MQTYLITHDDLDGAGCEVIIRKTFDAETVIAVHTDYKNINQILHEVLLKVENDSDSRLLITDISPEGKRTESLLDRLDTLYQADREVLLVDHHATTAHLSRYSWVVHVQDVCATRILYGMYKTTVSDDVTDAFTKAVDAYDRWQLDSSYRPRGEDLNRLYYFYGYERFVSRFSVNPEDDKLAAGLVQMLREKEDRDVSQAVEESEDYNQVLRKDSQGRVYYLLLVETYVSQVCHKILDTKPEVDYVVNLVLSKGKVDLRSRDNGVDVAEIAKRNGGGGHKPAAGFYVDSIESLDKLLAPLF